MEITFWWFCIVWMIGRTTLGSDDRSSGLNHFACHEIDSLHYFQLTNYLRKESVVYSVFWTGFVQFSGEVFQFYDLQKGEKIRWLFALKFRHETLFICEWNGNNNKKHEKKKTFAATLCALCSFTRSQVFVGSNLINFNLHFIN